jgi:pimeloyl-ACP methyl ester carboxylesterase
MTKILALLNFILLTGCIEFKISHEDALAHFESDEPVILFDSISVNGRNMHYAFTDGGRDSLVVFVHGSPGSWSAFIDFFGADSLLKMMDMIAVDRAGFGDSDFGIPDPSLENQSFQIHSIVSTFTQSTKILVGHSLGGPLIARMGMDYPQDYDKLILVAASVDPQLEIDGEMRSWLQNRFMKFLIPTDFWVSNEEIIPLKLELEKMEELWEGITCEVVVIQGTADSLVPKENANYVIRMVPDSLLKVVWLKDVDHFIPWTHPQEISKELLNSALK